MVFLLLPAGSGGGRADGHVRAASFSSRAIVPFLGGGGVAKKARTKRGREGNDDELSFEAEDGVWRKEAMMGEEVPAAGRLPGHPVCYDAEGRRLEQPPTPGLPLRRAQPDPGVLRLAHGQRRRALHT
ncbi:hypothetical protein U9M48_022218 [Paspalum notatum var. saurae]|uniref:Uncharacterized protein n=1 Tax=Paspalum notatum var. saurae TaxID=547442 RepID=A0AAQ3WUH7_PASNO